MPPKGSWFWNSWFRTGYPFQRRFLERGIIFRTHESSRFVSSRLKLFNDKLLLKIRFNALTNKLLYSCCQPRPQGFSLCFSVQGAGVFWREPRAASADSAILDYEEAFIWCISRTNKEISFLKNRVISIYKLSRTEYKKLAHFWNGASVLGRILERGIKIGPFVERGINFRGIFF